MRTIMRTLLMISSLFTLILISSTDGAESTDAAKQSTSAKKTSSSSRLLGMSVTGNKESPRSLTIVPWRDPLMNGKAPEITPVWQPKLRLLDPDAYRRDINLFIQHRNYSNKRN